MGLKSFFIKPIAKWIVSRRKAEQINAIALQEMWAKKIARQAANTAFGKDHDFASVNSIADLQARVPIKDYEGLRDYIDRVVVGESDVIWPGRPNYFCKTSGTTSGAKFIPLSKESLPYHISAARDALMHYVAETGKAEFFDHKMIFLQGSPVLDDVKGVPTGRLSGIVYHHVPQWLMRNRMPSYHTNCIEDWEQKVDKIVEETAKEPMSLISGIPPWVVMYFERLIAHTGKKNVAEIFPKFKLFVHGGVNYQPYKQRIENLIGFPIDTIETYPASEGFIAYQDSLKEEGLRLNVNAGMVFEFIPAGEVFDERPTRLSLAEVETDSNYALAMHTNAGLWGYLIGDTVRFTSLNPYRIKVTGRIKHYISAFGEHVIGEEVEKAMHSAIEQVPAEVLEFSVCPQVNDPGASLPYHEWLVEFSAPPADMQAFATAADKALQKANPYYKDLIEGKVLQPLKLRALPEGSFRSYMESIGKLGGQNKVPRLTNDRHLADALLALVDRREH
jgi:hypothetical protein